MTGSESERAEADLVCREEIVPRIADARVEREELTAGYEHMVSAISEVLFRHDPIGINLGTKADEYKPEAQTIVVRLRGATDDVAALEIVHEEFLSWFGQTAGPVERYREVALEIWQLWSQATKLFGAPARTSQACVQVPDVNPSRVKQAWVAAAAAALRLVRRVLAK